MARTVAKATNTELAQAIGARIREAQEAAGFHNFSEFCRQIGHVDQRLMRRYLEGESLIGLERLMEIADVCEVSLDWLAFGRDRPPAGLDEWLSSPLGQQAQIERPDLVRVLRSLPLRGFEPPAPSFYDAAYIALRSGLTPEQAAAASRATNLAR